MCAESSTLAEGMKFRASGRKLYLAARQEFNLLLACFEVKVSDEKGTLKLELHASTQARDLWPDSIYCGLFFPFDSTAARS